MAIDELKAKMGWGGATLEILISNNKCCQDTPLRGKVDIMGGKVAQKVRSIDLKLLRKWSTEHYGMEMITGSGPGYRGRHSEASGIQYQYELDGEKGIEVVTHIQLGQDIKLHAGMRQTYPFEIDISTIKREEGVHEDWILQARADIPAARDAIDEQIITIMTDKVQ